MAEYLALARGAAAAPNGRAATKSGPQAASSIGATGAAQAAFSHIAVSNALLIIGMFMPKLALAAFFDGRLGRLVGRDLGPLP